MTVKSQIDFIFYIDLVYRSRYPQRITVFSRPNINFFWRISTKAIAQRGSAEKVFLEISQNSQQNTCDRVSFLIKLQA